MAVRADDWAGMLAEVESRLDRPSVAAALGVEERDLDAIASGLAPKPKVERRLRALHAGTQPPLGATLPLAALPRFKTLLIAFVVVDAIVVAAIMLILFAR